MNTSKSPFELRKAGSLVEAWIGFKFEPAVDTTGLDQDLVRLFFEEVSPEFGDVEVAVEEKLEVLERTTLGLPRTIRTVRRPVRFRATDRTKSRIIQVERDLLSYHFLCENGEYAGFDRLRDESLERFAGYSNQFHPAGVLQVELHMLDMIDVPRSPNGDFRVEDYFNVTTAVPEEAFGQVADFSIQLVFAPGFAGDNLQLIFAPIASGTAVNLYRFRLQWDVICPCRPLITDSGQISGLLDRLHERLLTCFRSIFTARAWALFEPMENAEK